MVKYEKRGNLHINIMIDEFTPCLKDARTGELVQTEMAGTQIGKILDIRL